MHCLLTALTFLHYFQNLLQQLPLLVAGLELQVEGSINTNLGMPACQARVQHTCLE